MAFVGPARRRHSPIKKSAGILSSTVHCLRMSGWQPHHIVTRAVALVVHGPCRSGWNVWDTVCADHRQVPRKFRGHVAEAVQHVTPSLDGHVRLPCMQLLLYRFDM